MKRCLCFPLHGGVQQVEVGYSRLHSSRDSLVHLVQLRVHQARGGVGGQLRVQRARGGAGGQFGVQRTCGGVGGQFRVNLTFTQSCGSTTLD